MTNHPYGLWKPPVWLLLVILVLLITAPAALADTGDPCGVDGVETPSGGCTSASTEIRCDTGAVVSIVDAWAGACDAPPPEPEPEPDPPSAPNPGCVATFWHLADPAGWCASRSARLLAESSPFWELLIVPPHPALVAVPEPARSAIADAFPWERQAEAVRVARCESRFDPAAQNPSSSAGGLFQFVDRTWGWVASVLGLSDRFDAEQNARAASWLVTWTVEVEGRSPWAHWSCKPGGVR